MHKTIWTVLILFFMVVKVSGANSSTLVQGLHLKVYIVAEKKIFNTTDLLLQKLQETNDLMTATANIHLHILGLEVVDTEPFHAFKVDRKALETYEDFKYDIYLRLFSALKTSINGNVLLDTTEVLAFNEACSHKAIGSVNCPSSDNRTAAIIAYPLFRMILENHESIALKNDCGCQGDNDDHQNCITDNMAFKLTTNQACSCWKEAVDDILARKVTYPNGGSLDCLKTKPENSPNNGNSTSYPLLRNGVIEGKEECDCTVLDLKCKAICNDDGTLKPTAVPVSEPPELRLTEASVGKIILIVVIMIVVLAVIVGFAVFKNKKSAEDRKPVIENKQVREGIFEEPEELGFPAV